MPCSIIQGLTAVFCKFDKNALFRVFLHAEFISALKMEPRPMVFEKYGKNRKKNTYYHYFLFFVIFSKSFKQKFLIITESCFLDGKKPNITKLVDFNFLAASVKITRLYPVQKFKINGCFLQIL